MKIAFISLSVRACPDPLAVRSGHTAYAVLTYIPNQASAYSLTIIQPRHNSLEQPHSTADSTADSAPALAFIARLGSVTLLDFPLKIVVDVNSVRVVTEMPYSSCLAVPPSDVASSSVDMTGMLDCLIHFHADFWYHVNFVRLNWDVGSGGLQLCSFGLTRRVF